MESYLLAILVAVLVSLFIVYNRCSLSCKKGPFVKHKDEAFRRSAGMSRLFATGICELAAENGANATFVNACTSYQTLCGEDSTNIVVHDLANEGGGLQNNTDLMVKLLTNVQNSPVDPNTNRPLGCCDPNSPIPNDSPCTGRSIS